MEEIDFIGPNGIVVIDDLRYPGELARLKERPGFTIRLVTAHPYVSFEHDGTEGHLFGHAFDKEVPAKGLVPQGVLEDLLEDAWRLSILPRFRQYQTGEIIYAS